jgi:hypothetical protein
VTDRWLALAGALLIGTPALIWPREFLDRTRMFRPRDERDAARWVLFTRVVGAALILAGIGAVLGIVQVGNTPG